MQFTEEQQKQAQEFYAKIITKAWEDENFKQSLIEDPKTTIESFTGEKLNLPENMSIKVTDQSDSDTLYLNIPRNGNIENVELSEEQLEAVSGGLVISATIALVALGVAAFGAGVATYAAVKD